MKSALDTESAVVTGDARVYRQNLLSSVKHAHANHSLRVWLSLLDAVRSTMTECFTHLNHLLDVVRNNTLELVMDCQGCRIINKLFLEFPEHYVVGHVLETLLGDTDRLLLLIVHEYVRQLPDPARCGIGPGTGFSSRRIAFRHGCTRSIWQLCGTEMYKNCDSFMAADFHRRLHQAQARTCSPSKV